MLARLEMQSTPTTGTSTRSVTRCEGHPVQGFTEGLDGIVADSERHQGLLKDGSALQVEGAISRCYIVRLLGCRDALRKTLPMCFQGPRGMQGIHVGGACSSRLRIFFTKTLRRLKSGLTLKSDFQSPWRLGCQ